MPMRTSAAHVTLRYLLARAQLSPALDLVEKFVSQEKWEEAEEALNAFAKTLGVFLLGGDRVSIRTEWFSGSDQADKDRFLAFVQYLRDIKDEVYGKAHNALYENRREERMDAWFRQLREELPWVQDIMRDESDAFEHGPFKVIPLKGVHDTKEAIETLDKASALIEHKFPNVLYGKVYIRKDLRTKGTYDPRPGSGGLVAGSYADTTDTITLSMYATPDRNSLMTLVHEFGHRYHTKFLKGEKYSKFIQLYTVGEMLYFSRAEREKAADEYMTLFELHQKEEYPDDPSQYLSEKTSEYMNAMPEDIARKHINLLKRFRDEKDNSVWQKLHDAIALKDEEEIVEFPAQHGRSHITTGVYATPYGETSWQENFAESFLLFVLGKALPAPLQKFMESL